MARFLVSARPNGELGSVLRQLIARGECVEAESGACGRPCVCVVQSRRRRRGGGCCRAALVEIRARAGSSTTSCTGGALSIALLRPPTPAPSNFRCLTGASRYSH